jgi:hypothetical protein
MSAPLLCIVVHDVKNTRYYGTVSDGMKLSLTRTADDTVVFRHQALTDIDSSAPSWPRVQHLYGKYALTFTSRADHITQFWYIANDLSAVPLPEDLSAELAQNPDQPLPLQCSVAGIECVTVELNDDQQGELKSSTETCAKAEVLFKNFDDLPESFTFKNVKDCNSKAILGAVASITPASAQRMHTGLIVGLSVAAGIIVVLCTAVSVMLYKRRRVAASGSRSRTVA